ncbi:phosphatase PAP2 family protein [Salinisphaera sp. USBA-960]|nr:phosphatase PAP2 family protein [Salifodinibacter halophilus]
MMPVTVVDRWIGFQPWSIAFYLSLWVYVACAPVLVPDRRQLAAYLTTATGMALVGLAIFVVWPTRTPTLAADAATHPAVAWLHGTDHGYNACPSLHAAFSVLTAGWLERILRACGAPRLLRLINICWAVGIVYSTIATNQHVALDTLAGVALGGGTLIMERAFAWRHRAGVNQKKSTAT